MARLRIYGIARTRAFRVLWMAEELGLDYEHIAIETGPGGALKPDYIAVNPNGRLPAIDDDGFIMWESLAINIYLAKKHATGALYPADAPGEAKVVQWSLWAATKSNGRPMSGRFTPSGYRRRSVTRKSRRRLSIC
jgi:glutathione S-transferase